MSALSMNESKSVSVEKIENGYLRRESLCDANGGYSSKTTYFKTNPGMEGVGPRNAGNETARRAAAYLKRK